jgi:hypothetical protein
MRTIKNGSYDVEHHILRRIPGFHSGMPHAEAQWIHPGCQFSFHHVVGKSVDELFERMITRVGDDAYYDWSPIAFQLVRIEGGGHQRSCFAVFGDIISLAVPLTTRIPAVGGIKQSDVPFANFSQSYKVGFELFMKCNGKLEEGEIAHFGQPPPPHFGVIVEVQCPELSRFPPMRMKPGGPQITYEEGSDL